MTTTLRSGAVTVVMGDEIQELALELVRKAYPVIVEAMEDEVGKVHAEAKPQWPYRSGESRAALRVFRRVTPDSIIVGIRNDAKRNGVEYAYLIRFNVRGGFDHVWTRLVRRPMRKAQDRIVERAGPELVAAAERAVN